MDVSVSKISCGDNLLRGGDSVPNLQHGLWMTPSPN